MRCGRPPVRSAALAELISVIVTTYNRDDALDAVLRSLSRQDDRDFEVIVADDGSGPATARTVESWRNRIGVPLAMVWHEDRGFRAAEIRNRAILKAGGEYCIFLDGDCIAQADFVARHRRLAERGWFVTGNRLLMSQALTRRVLHDGLEPETWGSAAWFTQRLGGGINRLMPALRLPLGPLRKHMNAGWQNARSCNIAIWRSDLVRVDGFDADYRGWGREDSDLIVRLIRSGVRRKDGRFATGVLHLWHPENDRSRLEQNERMLEAALGGDRVRAAVGLSALKAEERG